MLRRSLLGTSVGTVMEWFDIGVFGYLITTMGPVFLPGTDPTTQTLFLFGTFASTFVARPVGGMFYGWLGDRIGRRAALASTLSLIAASTFLIGLLPGHDRIGAWAAVLLVVLKITQGFSAGGEYAGGATFVCEYAPDRHRGFYSGFMGSSYLGFALGAGVVTGLELLLGHAAMESYGWRIPFLLAGPLGLIALYLRFRVEESPAFRAVRVAQEHVDPAHPTKVGPLHVLRSHGYLVLAGIGVVAAENIVAYALTSYMPTYLTTSLEFSQAQGTLLTFPLLLATGLFVPLGGAISDRVGRRPILWAASTIAFLSAVPAFYLMRLGGVWTAVPGLALLALAAGLSSAGLASALPAQFPTASRASGMGLSYNIAAAAFGGTTPFVLDALVSGTGSAMMPAYYVMAAAAVGCVSVCFLKETARRPLPGSMPRVGTSAEAHMLVEGHPRDSLLDFDALPLPTVPFLVTEEGHATELVPEDPRVVEAIQKQRISTAPTQLQTRWERGEQKSAPKLLPNTRQGPSEDGP
ncbi:MFS transporter [Streptomyces sp. NPDC000151]|uniref:MFS transporter n=1 Tax=Streptomyces sp. NPDC000151 TaxID=3154244 RepID=UPI00333451C9